MFLLSCNFFPILHVFFFILSNSFIISWQEEWNIFVRDCNIFNIFSKLSISSCKKIGSRAVGLLSSNNIVRITNNGLHFILFSFSFSYSFYFQFIFISLRVRIECNVRNNCHKLSCNDTVLVTSPYTHVI